MCLTGGMNQKSMPEDGTIDDHPCVDLRPLREALAQRNDVAIRRALMAISNLNSSDPDTGESALHALSRAGHMPGVEIVLRRGGNTEVRDRLKRTPMHLAAIADKPEVIHALALSNADAESIASDGRRPIHNAVFNKAKNALKALIEVGVDVNAKCSTGDTAIHFAVTAAGDVPEITDILLETKKVDYSVRDCNGDTPLHLACEYRNNRLTRALIRQSAPTSIFNKLMLTPDLMPSAYPQKDNIECRNLIAQARWIRQTIRYNKGIKGHLTD